MTQKYCLWVDSKALKKSEGEPHVRRTHPTSRPRLQSPSGHTDHLSDISQSLVCCYSIRAHTTPCETRGTNSRLAKRLSESITRPARCRRANRMTPTLEGSPSPHGHPPAWHGLIQFLINLQKNIWGSPHAKNLDRQSLQPSSQTNLSLATMASRDWLIWLLVIEDGPKKIRRAKTKTFTRRILCSQPRFSS